MIVSVPISRCVIESPPLTRCVRDRCFVRLRCSVPSQWQSSAPRPFPGTRRCRRGMGNTRWSGMPLVSPAPAWPPAKPNPLSALTMSSSLLARQVSAWPPPPTALPPRTRRCRGRLATAGTEAGGLSTSTFNGIATWEKAFRKCGPLRDRGRSTRRSRTDRCAVAGTPTSQAARAVEPSKCRWRRFLWGLDDGGPCACAEVKSSGSRDSFTKPTLAL